MNNSGRGLTAGVLAYVLWGGFPLYWPLLKPAGAVEVLAHRIVWSAVAMTLVVLLLRRWPGVVAIVRDRRRFGLLTVAAAVITVNWGTYIWAVNHGRVVEASLGYFINPLVTVLMGVLVLRERLRPLQWVALGIAFTAVLVLTLDYGRLPWVALVLAFSFGTYGLAKKQADTGAMESLTVETLVLLPLAAGYVGWLTATGASNFGQHGTLQTLLFLGTGVVTAVPLVLFGAAATSLNFVTLGLLQYLAPIIQFAIGVALYHEAMPTGRWIGFGIVWLALALFTFEAVQHRRRHLRMAAEASAV